MKPTEKIKFLLINPTSPLWRVSEHQRPSKAGFFRFSMLPSLYVAASMPSWVETRIIDEDVEPIDIDADVDLVGFSFMTYNAPRAYELADQFRARGIPVIFGGFHPTFVPGEAKEHADAVCIGECENNVPEMMEDFRNGRLKPFYKNELVDLKNLPALDRSLIRRNAYIVATVLQATRGCYHHCEFCSVASFGRYQLRTRPISHVIDELRTLGRNVLFMDDNITLDKEYAKELFRQMIPMRKRWFSQCGIGIAEDDELLDLAAKSGCKGLFLGFESLSQQCLEGYSKHCNRKRDYLEIAKKVHKAGIAIFAGFVFGSDEDGPDVFANTLDFLLEANMEALQSTRLTPFPGTPIFEKMEKEGRILDRDWSHYDFHHMVHAPKNMDPETVNLGTSWLQREFYNRKNILRRLRRDTAYLKPNVIARAIIPLNLGYRYRLMKYGAFRRGAAFQPELY